MKVFIIESSNPEDFYRRELDGRAAQGILNNLGIRNELRLAMDREYFQKAIADAKTSDCTVIHLSCHGNKDGVALTSNYQPSWDKFASFFQNIRWCPKALFHEVRWVSPS